MSYKYGNIASKQRWSPTIHIVTLDDIHLGKLRRKAGRCLCEPHYHHTEIRNVDEVRDYPRCERCLKIAQNHDIQVDD